MKIVKLLVAAPALVAALVSGTAAPVHAVDTRPAGPTHEEATAPLPSLTFLRSLATGYSLDSNEQGHVYAIPSNFGRYQKWLVFPEASGSVQIVDWQTWRCLDSNFAGRVYTLPCNRGAYQSWDVQPSAYGTVNLFNVATGYVLDGASAVRLHDGCQRRVLSEVDSFTCHLELIADWWVRTHRAAS